MEFFDMYERLLTSSNYVARRQSLKLLTVSGWLLASHRFPFRASKFTGHEPLHFRNPESESHHDVTKESGYDLSRIQAKILQNSAFRIFKVFVANPNKSQEIKIILAKNHEKLLDLLNSLSIPKGLYFVTTSWVTRMSKNSKRKR
ncbi:Calcium-binding protein 39-like-like protein [Drosera capensis]